MSEHDEGNGKVYVIDFASVGRKKLAAKFVEVEAPPDPANTPIDQRRNPELEARIAKAPADIEAYRAYGEWLVANGVPQGRLVSLQCDPPSAAAPRIERNAYDAKLAHLAEAAIGPLAPFVSPDPLLAWTLERGFIKSLTVRARSTSELLAVMRIVRQIRETAFVRELLIDTTRFPNGESLDPFWDECARDGPLATVTSLALPSPGARGLELAPLFERVEQLRFRDAGRLRLPALPEVVLLELHEPGHEAVDDACARAPKLHLLSIRGDVLDERVLRVLAQQATRLEHVGTYVYASEVAASGSAERVLETIDAVRALPHAQVVMTKLIARPASEGAPADRDVPAPEGATRHPFTELAEHRRAVESHEVPPLSARHVRRLWTRGWCGAFEDDDWDATAAESYREFPTLGVTATVTHRLVSRERELMVDDTEERTQDEIHFTREGRRIPLGEVPPLAYSEAMGDLLPTEKKRVPSSRAARAPTPSSRLDDLMDLLARVAADRDARADFSRAIEQVGREAVELAALVLAGKATTADEELVAAVERTAHEALAR